MPLFVNNRLTVLGARKVLDKFEGSPWLGRLRGEHLETYRVEKARRTWWFETEKAPVPELVTLSRQWPHIVLLLHFEHETGRAMGLAKATKGRLELCQLCY